MRYTHQLMIAFAMGAGARLLYDKAKAPAVDRGYLDQPDRATQPPRVPPVIPRVTPAPSYGRVHRIEHRDGN